MVIRPMKVSDVDLIHSIGTTCKEFDVSSNFTAFWTKLSLEHWCQSKDDLMLIAANEGQIIGFIFFACHIPTGKVTLENIWVDPQHRKRGVANQLIEYAFEQLKKRSYRSISAVAVADNATAQQFLQRMGFLRGKHCLWLDHKL
jgi:ribosomal protein S18 acetylase RimI-like enzyme